MIKKFMLMCVCGMLLAAVMLSSCNNNAKPDEVSVQTEVEAERNVFENQSVEISANDGKVVVSGSFDNVASESKEYAVSCIITKGTDSKPLEMTKKFALEKGANSFEFQFSITAKEQNVKVSVYEKDTEQICEPVEKNIKSLRILSIGNSFSVDAQQHLYGIAKDAGYDNIVLGNLYIGGCSLSGHVNSGLNDRPSYTYYKNTTGEWTETAEQTMLFGITDENWDYITLQQQSGASGQADTYNHDLTNLISFVKKNMTNPDAELLWHMTWAYASDCTQDGFSVYNKDQMKMYDEITNAVEQKILANSDISFVIPSGTAVQNARASSLGDTLCRDGFHLELGYGRYLAGLTWFHKITGESIDGITYIPDNMFDGEILSILKECAKNAVNNPFEVTK